MLSVLLDQSQARLFKVQKPGTSTACIMVDIDFKAEVQAIKNNQVVASKTLTSDDKGITSTGVCSGPTAELLVKFEEKTFWYIAFRPPRDQPKPMAQYRGFEVLPTEIFGPTVGVSSLQFFYDPKPVYQDNVSDSYSCQVTDQTAYQNTKPPTSDYSFRVNVTVSSIHSQGFEIQDDQFGPAEKCSGLP